MSGESKEHRRLLDKANKAAVIDTLTDGIRSAYEEALRVAELLNAPNVEEIRKGLEEAEKAAREAFHAFKAAEKRAPR